MARNGAGSYVRVSGTPYVYNTVIDQVVVNAEMDDIATALTGSIAKDGQTTPTANLPMGTYRHTGVGNGSARTDYAAMGQVQDGKINWVDGGGTADAITATYSPAITALVDGQVCYVRATAANTTTTPTFAPNGLTAHTIVKTGGGALVAGEIAGDGHELILRYDLTNTRWELLNPAVTTTTIGALPLSGNKTVTGDIVMSGAIAMSGASVFDASASIAAHATTMDPWSLGNYVTLTGAAVTFTAMANAPQAGAEVELYMNAAHVFTDGAVFEVDGNANWTAAIGDRVLLRAKSTTVFTVHPRKADGTAVAGASIASQAEMESASSNTVAVPPGRAHFHPGVAKFVASVTVSGSVATLDTTHSYGVTSVTRNGSNDYTLNLSVTFSAANWAGCGWARSPAASNEAPIVHVYAVGSTHPTTTSVRVLTGNYNGSMGEVEYFSVVGFGDF